MVEEEGVAWLMAQTTTQDSPTQMGGESEYLQ